MTEDEDEAARHGEDEHTGLLPTPERIETMTRPELIEMRDLLADWVGPSVEQFRDRVAERLADTDEDAPAEDEGGTDGAP